MLVNVLHSVTNSESFFAMGSNFTFPVNFFMLKRMAPTILLSIAPFGQKMAFKGPKWVSLVVDYLPAPQIMRMIMTKVTQKPTLPSCGSNMAYLHLSHGPASAGRGFCFLVNLNFKEWRTFLRVDWVWGCVFSYPKTKIGNCHYNTQHNTSVTICIFCF